ncbi:MAG TPA: glycosyltransferase family 2 protein [Candidatus Dormibacteraeota bacterium]|nr:glycosyltransferase family 2 protein [Candidatus Dormibacteraeota bacterium]
MPEMLSGTCETSFSIVIPTFNRAHILPRCLDSVLGQRWRNCEVIVVDDGSSDDVEAVIQRYAARGVTFLRNEINLGVGPTRNKGVRFSRGEWIVFLDSDSYLVPGALSVLDATIRTCDSKVGVVYGKSAQIEGQRPSLTRPRHMRTRWNFKEYIEASYLEEALPATRRAILLRFPFEETLGIKRECGCLVWYAIGRAGYDFVWTRDMVQHYDISPDGLSGRRFLAAHPEEMVICNQKIIERFGSDLLEFDKRKLVKLHQKTAFYCIMADRRACALRHLDLAWKLDRVNFRTFLLLALCRTSARTARKLYPVIALVGA